MSPRSRFFLLLLGFATAGTASAWIQSPGYMDADYYYATALRLSTGHGFTEPFLWNYLDDPAGIPHPSHLYWMPLVSLIAAAFAAVLGPTFAAARLPMLLMTAVLPLTTAEIAYSLLRDPVQARTAGTLAAFQGFFLPFFLTTDSFALFALLGGLIFAASLYAAREKRLSGWIVVGALIGLAHLTRVDGALLLLPAAYLAWTAEDSRRKAIAWLIFSYLIVITPWLIRMYGVTGSLSSPSTARVLWMTGYDELFAYPPGRLAPDRWLGSGLEAILRARMDAILSNLQSLIAVNGLVFLAPLMLVGGYRLRREPLVRAAAVYLILLLVVMSLVFPFAGARGGYFHSSAALMPVLWAMASIGLDAAVGWGARVRGWKPDEALRVFRVAAVGLAAALTGALFVARVGLVEPGQSAWGESQRVYRSVGEALARLRAEDRTVAVNNPPGFYLATGRTSVVIPDGSPEALQSVVRRYGVGWVVLEKNHPVGLNELYQDPDSEAWLEVAGSLPGLEGATIYILRVRDGEGAP